MAMPMDSPRTTIALGPLEISLRRREDNVRLGVLVSLVVHLLILAFLTVAPIYRPMTAEAEALRASNPPVPITFVNPPSPPPSTPRRAEEFSARPPRPASAKPLTMESVPEVTAALQKRVDTDRAEHAAGRKDTKPPGGEQGGPRLDETPGVPPPAPAGAEALAAETTASNPDEPKDILGRLRAFKKAVESPRPSTSQGREGGGRGSGGVAMPNLPDTGFGVGNLEFEGRDYDWENYGRQIHGIIWRAWHNRLLITASVFERWAAEHRTWMLDHRNGVRFTILRSGQVVDVAIETASGCYPLDDSATDALREVVLPPLPADFQRDSETVHARFIAEGEIREMKPFLQQMKNAGFF